MKKIFAITLIFSMFLCSCQNNDKVEDIVSSINNIDDVSEITLTEEKGGTIEGKKIKEYDYTWQLDCKEGEESFKGDEPSSEGVYIAHDIVYFPELDEKNFKKEKYDDENEWVYYCESEDEELSKYVLATLPILGNSLPTEMMHSEEEAYDNMVLHITKPGNYEIGGTWHGQIKIDLGEDAYDDESQKVNLILDGLDVTCDVGPAILFENVYEADNQWEEREEYSEDVDITGAGARVIVVDGSVNNITGANVYRILKPEYKKEGKTVQKKRYKYDGAFYSRMSLLITGETDGTGILNINGTTYEGLDSELHLTIDNCYVNIVTNDDGINVNEDDVSVFTMNGGRLTIFAGQGAEGDVIDSNGYINVKGGIILGTTPSMPDEILDSQYKAVVSDDAKVISSKSGKENKMQKPSDMRNFDGQGEDFNQPERKFNFGDLFKNRGSDDSNNNPPSLPNDVANNETNSSSNNEGNTQTDMEENNEVAQ